MLIRQVFEIETAVLCVGDTVSRHIVKVGGSGIAWRQRKMY